MECLIALKVAEGIAKASPIVFAPTPIVEDTVPMTNPFARPSDTSPSVPNHTLLGWEYPIPPPHEPCIHYKGSLPIFEGKHFSLMTFNTEDNLSSSSVALSEIVFKGFNPIDPNNLIPQEVVQDKLNATTGTMIWKGLSKEKATMVLHIKSAMDLGKS